MVWALISTQGAWYGPQRTSRLRTTFGTRFVLGLSSRLSFEQINVGPLIDNFSQRMQYSTIKNNFQAFNDGPNDHLDTSQPPPQTVTYLR